MTEQIEVTQTDRDAAEAFNDSLKGRVLISDRKMVVNEMAQVFARYRLAHTAGDAEPVATEDTKHLGFHYKDGWFFARRGARGDVLLYQKSITEAGRLILTIDASSWASIVCSVSAEGETGDRHLAALAFHSPEERGSECQLSPNGLHQVDTSMESGPNNCFHCEKPMPRLTLVKGDAGDE